MENSFDSDNPKPKKGTGLSNLVGGTKEDVN